MDNKEKASGDAPKSSINFKAIKPRIITGFLHQQNKGAIDWGWQSLIAYGCQTAVVVIDPKTVQLLQVLNKHRAYITKVKWAKENYYHDIPNPYYPKLASADVNGTIIVWDVVYSKVSSLFSDGNGKPILDMQWLSFWSSFNDFLAVLHPPYSLIIWNTTNGNKLWKKSYTETLQSFSFDPFDPSNVAFLVPDGILFIDDFTLSKVPSSNGRKFYISNPSMMSSSSSNLLAAAGSIQDEKSWTKERLRQRMRSLVNAEPKASGKNDSGTAVECLGLMHHQSVRNQIILLYAKEALIIDLELNQTVGLLSSERNGSPFVQIYCCQQRDALYCLHENGSISFRTRRKLPVSSSVTDSLSTTAGNQSDYINDTYSEISYDIRCLSDSMRLTKHVRLMGMTFCPISETKVALLLSEGKLILIELTSYEKAINLSKELNASSGSALEAGFVSPPKICLADLIPPSNITETVQAVHFKFLITGLYCGVAAPLLTLRMCPPLTTKNWASYQPLLGTGNLDGTIQIFCMASGMLQKEINVHTCPVRGIEWVSLYEFLSFAYPNVNSSQVRNEVVLVNAISGKLKHVRWDKGDESPIEMLRVSCFKQYFIIAFKEEPFELWDLTNLCLLRTMPKKFPIITALEWSPVGNTKKKISSVEKSLSLEESESVSQTITEKIPLKEQFVFTDSDGQLYNFSVEGNIIKDGTKIPATTGMGSITCIAWRSEQIVMGDVDGNITIWDLKARVSKTKSTHRGWIKKIRFAPGRGNMKILILYNDGVDVWDLSTIELLSGVKCPKDLPKIVDVDWAASDTSVLASVDGCLYLMDLKFKHSMAPTYRYHLEELVFSPHLSTSEAALNLRTFLNYQGWRKTYSLEFSEADGIKGDDLIALNQYISAIDIDIRDFLPHCQFGTAQRCLLTARLFGDESEINFWTVALYYLKKEGLAALNTENDSEVTISKTSLEQISADQILDCCYDVLCDTETYRRRQLEKCGLHDSKRATSEQTKKCADSLIMLGHSDRAVRLLLETDSSSEDYKLDCLKACLVASVCSSGTAQSTIKLVATNLIANGHISEGVQLLCLIGKPIDACRYLLSYGEWTKAVWLAKSTLDSSECCEVLKRWVDHLFSPVMNQKQKGILVLLSLGQFQKVVESLISTKCIERAVMFIHACNEFGLLRKSELNSAVIESAFLEYARYLFSLGNTPAAFYYCSLIGEAGEQLRKEMEILANDN